MLVHQYTHLCTGETVRARYDPDGSARLTVYDADGEPQQYLLLDAEQALLLLADLRDTPRVVAAVG